MLNCVALICLAAIIVVWLRGFHIVKTPTADELYGCTLAQQAPNGDCP